jgi:hypothetical protein
MRTWRYEDEVGGKNSFVHMAGGGIMRMNFQSRKHEGKKPLGERVVDGRILLTSLERCTFWSTLTFTRCSFTPNHVRHCWANVIRGHGSACGHYCANAIRGHCRTTLCRPWSRSLSSPVPRHAVIGHNSENTDQRNVTRILFSVFHIHTMNVNEIWMIDLLFIKHSFIALTSI